MFKLKRVKIMFKKKCDRQFSDNLDYYQSFNIF